MCLEFRFCGLSEGPQISRSVNVTAGFMLVINNGWNETRFCQSVISAVTPVSAGAS